MAPASLSSFVLPVGARSASACAGLLSVLFAGACASAPDPMPGASGARLVATVSGLMGPEAVRYDPARDVHYVANWNGAGDAIDDNGFISRIGSDGAVRDLRWIDGASPDVTLHAPRGMVLGPAHLWVADVDAVRSFALETGRPAGAVSFAGQDVGFLNDVAFGPDGRLYVTDTGRNRIYRLDVSNPDAPSQAIEVALSDSALARPNGITWDAAARQFVVVPIGGTPALFAWTPGTSTFTTRLTGIGGRYDGVEVHRGALIVASQADSSIQVYRGTTGMVAAKLAGRPADIGLDTRRGRVAVPYIALNRVEIWEIPGLR